MAFGKNQENLKNVPSFRRAFRQQKKDKPANKSSSIRYFSDRFNPSLVTPDTIRILRQSFTVETPDYHGELPYFPYLQHYHAKYKRSFICSGGPHHMDPTRRNQCLGCDAYEEEQNAPTKTVSKRSMYAFSVLHYAPYAYAPQTDRSGAPIINQKTKEPFMQWVQVQPHEKNKYKNNKMKSAHVLHWSLGFGHLSVLEEYDRVISNSCRNCGGENCIESEAWSCPKCGEIIIDMNSTELSPQAIEDLVFEPVKCPACQNIVMPHEHVRCAHCSDAVRADMFDVDLTIKRTKPSDNSSQNLLTVIKYSTPRPIDPIYKDIAVPLDLQEIFKPDTIQRQQSIFKINPNTQPQFREYGAPLSDDDDNDEIPF